MRPNSPMTMVLPEQQVRDRVHQLVPELWSTLGDLVRHRSVATTPAPPLADTAEVVAELFRAAGLRTAKVETITHGGKTSAPMVVADEVAHTAVATVLLYAHYDVQPADASKWTTKPFEPTEKMDENHDMRLYGRGAADDKSGVMMHLGAIKALLGDRGQLPLNIKLVIEGEEEAGSSVLESYLAEHPDDPRFHADLVIVADAGNVERGAPTLTETLRGIVAAEVTVETLAGKAHSGMFGGPVPDAFMALVQILATLQDRKTGDVAIAGLTQFDHAWPTVTEATYRRDAGVLPTTSLIGSGTIAKLLYGKPSVNVVGLSGLPLVSGSTNVLCPKAKARVSLRLAPNQDAGEAYAALEAHIMGAAPWGLKPVVKRIASGSGFVSVPGEHSDDIERALLEAYHATSVARAGQGGSIPLVNALQAANPESDIVLWGCEEPTTHAHGADESVSQSELEHMTLAEALLLRSVMSPIPIQPS
ncbi:M20/M25/M40 family metallo-hydrolase [Actinokineospora globicatena]|uniref:M20/M25/M40 family metallo-hydrolase n=1 Tax=Actinokineospora globicatena TaxID=103729 RepID=UPI0020A2434C|nr:M20/M25/M40 family metallo-hydrolase [Actinokineospora globicatena]MCP2305866.1 Acetylornithine deacetylase/Succinyl-diaminopimelate desuccinylase [Actinokineospora globicatena]GLW80265.1 dipeptidase [Actinokineospora globicatena]GLW87094.1 dipeptidase [Actinokineospora globicatena]